MVVQTPYTQLSEGSLLVDELCSCWFELGTLDEAQDENRDTESNERRGYENENTICLIVGNRCAGCLDHIARE